MTEQYTHLTAQTAVLNTEVNTQWTQNYNHNPQTQNKLPKKVFIMKMVIY